jgi:hypothetical protein
MDRRDLLRRTGAALTTAAGIGIAGCSGGGDGGSDGESDGGDGGSGGDGSDGGGSGTPAGTVDVDLSDDGLYSLGEYTSSVEGIQVVGLSSGSQSFESGVVMTIDVEVRNAGGQPTEIAAYTYNVVLYDESGSQLKDSNPATGTSGAQDSIEPGASANVTLSVQLRDISPDDVASYDLTVDCSGSFADGEYCS